MTPLPDQAPGATTAAALAPLYARPGFLVRRAEQRADTLLAETGGDVTRTQYGVLFVLSRIDGLDQRRLAELMHIDRTTVGVVLGVLERKGYVRRTRAPEDRRRRVLALTGSGRRALPAVERAASEAQERLLARLSTEERAELVRLLNKIVEG